MFLKAPRLQDLVTQPEQTRTLTTGVCVHAQSLQSCLTLCDPPWTVAHQAPLSMGFSRQEYWRELPFLSAEDLPNQGSKLCLSPLLCCRRILYLLNRQESHYHESCLSNYSLVAKRQYWGAGSVG